MRPSGRHYMSLGDLCCCWHDSDKIRVGVLTNRNRLFILDMKSMEACMQGIKTHIDYNSKFTLKMNTRNIVIQSVGSIQLFKATCLLSYVKRI